LADLATFDDVRRMALRARQLDPDLLVSAMTSARAEILAFDAEAARREFAAVESTEPGRRDRLLRLACSDPRFIALRWHTEIGATLGCPEVPPEWFVLRSQGIIPGADAGDDDVPPPVEPDAAVMPGIDLTDLGYGDPTPSPAPTPTPPGNQVRPTEGTAL
jgi:hypothetical protein